MKKIAIYGFLLILASLQVACKDWLDVKPRRRLKRMSSSVRNKDSKKI